MFMNRLLVTLMVFATLVVSGCATHPEDRPYTVEESHQLALEALYRRGLSYDEYHRVKLQIERQQPAPYGFPGMGEVNAERSTPTKDRQG
jgi:hypothetical protein